MIYHEDWENKSKEFPIIWYRQVLRRFAPDSRNLDINFVCPDGDVVPRWYTHIDPLGRVGLWEFKQGPSNRDKLLENAQKNTFELLNLICENSTHKDRWLGVTLFWCMSWEELYKYGNPEIKANGKTITKEHFFSILCGETPPPKYPYFH